MSVSVFISTVTDEFRSYRDLLVHDLTRQNVAVKVQEDFKDLGGDTLAELDTYIAACDAVVHLVGDMCGSPAGDGEQQALLAKYRDLSLKLPPFGDALKDGAAIPYTQWEAWLALLHGKQLYVARPEAAAPRGPSFVPTEASRAGQAAHLERLKAAKRYAFDFTNPDNLAKQILASGILDLLVKDYASDVARGRAVAEGFIAEMSKRVAGDKALDLDGMKQQVRNAIDVYVNEIAGRPIETNLDDIVGHALSRAKAQVDKGQSGLARAALRRAAEEMRRDEEERRERFVAGVTALYTRERDIALAAYDGDAAAEAIVALARALHGDNAVTLKGALKLEAQGLYEYGRDRGSNVHLVAAIALHRKMAPLAASPDEKGEALVNLGNALETLGKREVGTARLDEAVAAFRVAIEETTRERSPLNWAAAKAGLGLALFRSGEREGDITRLKRALQAFRAALEEQTRESAPLDWATTQIHLGHALRALGERENATAWLNKAVAAYHAALQERTRERLPLKWATAQNGLGKALQALGERERGTARLEGAVVAYRAALEERGRERVPLQWAATQNNLGDALLELGKRERGTARLEEAVTAYSEALKERTRERVPLGRAATFGNHGVALMLIADRTNDAAMAATAVAQIETAYEALRDGGDMSGAEYFESQLAKARAIRNRLSGE